MAKNGARKTPSAQTDVSAEQRVTAEQSPVQAADNYAVNLPTRLEDPLNWVQKQIKTAPQPTGVPLWSLGVAGALTIILTVGVIWLLSSSRILVIPPAPTEALVPTQVILPTATPDIRMTISAYMTEVSPSPTAQLEPTVDPQLADILARLFTLEARPLPASSLISPITAQVTTSILNVRAQPAEFDPILGKIQKDKIVSVWFKTTSGWLLISGFNEQEPNRLGYISGSTAVVTLSVDISYVPLLPGS